MLPFLAGVILFAVLDGAVSGLLWLPAAALAESLPARRPDREASLWFAALGLPHLLAAAAVVYAARLHAFDPVPWEVRNAHVRHLCFWGLAQSPDAAYRTTAFALLAGAAVLVGVLRPFLSAFLSWRYSQVLERTATEVPELQVRLTPLETPWSTCAGFLRPRVYLTTGLAELLTPDELSAVIAHERAHARRRDNLKVLGAQALFGPTIVMPSAHYCYRRLRASLERAADAEALRSEADSEALASAMLRATQKLREAGEPPEDRGFRTEMAARRREELVAERVGRILEAAEEGDDAGRGVEERSPARRLALAISTALLSALLLGVAEFVKPSVRCLYESVLAALGRQG